MSSETKSRVLRILAGTFLTCLALAVTGCADPTLPLPSDDGSTDDTVSGDDAGVDTRSPGDTVQEDTRPPDDSGRTDTSVGDTGTTPDIDAEDASPEDTAPPPGCDDPGVEPMHEATMAFPGENRAGQPLLVDVEANTPLSWVSVAGDGPSGPVSLSFRTVDDLGGRWRWRFSLATAVEGRYCLTFRYRESEGGSEFAAVSGTVDVTGSGGNTVAGYEVAENHQLTCAEEIDWGIDVFVRVEDASGAPVSGARVLVEGNYGPPWPVNEWNQRFIDSPPPTELVTDGNGEAHFENYWPVIELESGEKDWFVFSLKMADAPSDVATEITTGFWETSPSGCRYCPGQELRNVWGHWSYRVVFRGQSELTELCHVPTDHAGQQACDDHDHAPHPTGCWQP